MSHYIVNLFTFILFMAYSLIGPSPLAMEGHKGHYQKILKLFKKYNQKWRTPVISAKEMKKKKVVLVDVRTFKEYNVSKIPGAMNIKEFKKTKDKYKNETIVLYCTIGYRSGKYAKELIKEKFKAYNLEGSVLGWAHTEGILIDQNGRPTKKVHIYDKEWNFLPKGFKEVY